jgi:hypothetical protein
MSYHAERKNWTKHRHSMGQPQSQPHLQSTASWYPCLLTAASTVPEAPGTWLFTYHNHSSMGLTLVGSNALAKWCQEEERLVS